jgi:hypothetical protein
MIKKAFSVLVQVADLQFNSTNEQSALDESVLISVGLERVKFARADTTQGEEGCGVLLRRRAHQSGSNAAKTSALFTGIVSWAHK